MRRISVIKILAVSIAGFQQTYISPTGKIKCRIVRQRGSRGAHSIVSEQEVKEHRIVGIYSWMELSKSVSKTCVESVR